MLPFPNIGTQKRAPLNAYEGFLNNVEEFRKRNSLPVEIHFGQQEQLRHLAQTLPSEIQFYNARMQ